MLHIAPNFKIYLFIIVNLLWLQLCLSSQQWLWYKDNYQLHLFILWLAQTKELWDILMTITSRSLFSVFPWQVSITIMDTSQSSPCNTNALLLASNSIFPSCFTPHCCSILFWVLSNILSTLIWSEVFNVFILLIFLRPLVLWFKLHLYLDSILDQ